jgi:hypothetical protein
MVHGTVAWDADSGSADKELTPGFWPRLFEAAPRQLESRVALGARGGLVGTSSAGLGTLWGAAIVQRPARASAAVVLGSGFGRKRKKCRLKIIARGAVYLAWSPETST